MAYSGLGTGTQADPYQITTVSQFKEMDDATYEGTYFLLMNDLDFAAEASVSLLNYKCKLNGGGHSIDNIPLDADGFINLYSGCSITNCNFIFNRVSVADSAIFKGSWWNDVTLSTLSFIVENKHGLTVQLFDANSTIALSCTVEFIKAEGNFSRVFPSIAGSLTGITVYNSNGGHVPLVSQSRGDVTFLRCVYHKPFTKTVSGGSMGLFIDSPTHRVIINECAVIVKKYINESTASSISLGGFVGRGKMEIRNSYVVGSFEAPRGYYFHALYGSYTKDDCIFSDNYFYGNLVSNRKADTDVVADLPSTGCYYCKELITNQNYNDQYATALTVEQFKDESNFLGWDFTNIWAMGVDNPYLRNSSASLSKFNPVSLLQTGPISIGAIQRISRTQFSVQLITDNTADFGIEVSDNGVEVDTKFNEKGTLIFNTTKDYDAVLKVFYFAGQARMYGASQSYYHYYLDQIAVTDVTVDKYISLEKSGGRGAYIHGSILIGDYLYGTSRGSYYTTTNSIVKVLASDVSQFEVFPISVLSGKGAWQMDSVCQIGNKLYTVAADSLYHNYMIVFDLLTNTHQSYFINETNSSGAASCTDGTYLYVCLGRDLVSKIDPAVFNSSEKYNTSSPWPLQSLDFVNTSGIIAPHTMVVDSEHLYVGLGNGSSYSETSQTLLKINKQTMQLVTAATGVPKMTDDMCQTDTHLFVGIEPNSSTSYGAKIGCCAIRKSDMRVTMIRKLHETDLPDVNSYASLIFGKYLIDLKTNSHIYALDISNPDSWNDDDRGAHTLKVYKIFKPGGTTITDPINEVYLTESGKFVGFAWNSISYAVSFDLPGLDYFAEPTVITDDAAIVGDTGVSLSGYITSTGGKAVSEIGIIIGQVADLSDGTPFPVTPVTTEFEKAFNDLDFGTYYFRTYAINAEGTGYGEIKSFTLEYFAAPTVITEDAAIIGDDGASISGYIQDTGGKTVTAIGVILGQAADLSDGVNYPVTPIVNEFGKVFSNLAFGTYYFRTYATNAEGMGYGEIKSFTLEPSYTEPGQPSGLDKAIQAEISISWMAPADDGGTPIIGYKIERKISGGEWEIIVADTGNTNTTYTETLPQGVYQYRVSAITAYGAGSSSATLYVNAVVGGGGAGAGAYKIYLGSTEIVVL